MRNGYVTLGWSSFAREHCRRGTGHSYSRLSESRVVELVLDGCTVARSLLRSRESEGGRALTAGERACYGNSP